MSRFRLNRAMSWHNRSVEAVFDAVGSSADGLSRDEVSERLEHVGPNELTVEQARSPLTIFVAQFSSALIWVLLAAAGLSFTAGYTVDAILIGVIVFVNGVFGFVQDYRAERSLEALRDLAAPSVRVRRDGTEQTVDSHELVPGDVILLEQGEVIPADARLIEVHTLEVDEAPLTGESLPVPKGTDVVPTGTPLAERTDMVYKATNVSRGTAVVVETGMDTEVGAIAMELLEAEEPETPLQRDLHSLGRRVGVGIVTLSLVIVPILVVGGESLVQAALTAVSLSVAAIPEGLPAVVTLTLALGVRRMAEENALTRSLPAVEALGTVDVVCTDKTGTLTEGTMHVNSVWVHDETYSLETANEQVETLLEIGVLCNDATLDHGDPTERALLRAAKEYGIDIEELRTQHPRRDEIPFSSERRMMATFHDDGVYVKGAAEVVLDRSSRILTADGVRPLDSDIRTQIEKRMNTFASQALRVLVLHTRRQIRVPPRRISSSLVSRDSWTHLGKKFERRSLRPKERGST